MAKYRTGGWSTKEVGMGVYDKPYSARHSGVFQLASRREAMIQSVR